MLNRIEINNYRNLGKATCDLNQGINYLVQQNGFGKTNFLETIYFSIFRKSFRPMVKLSELIGPAGEFAKVCTEWEANNLELKILNDTKLFRKVTLNTKTTTLGNILKKFSIILFAPHSVDLVNGEPSIRRSDLDDFLSSLHPEYSDLVSRYKVVLRNRNALIKAINENKSTRNQLKFWTEEIARVGSLIYEARRQFFNDIKDFVDTTSGEIYHDFNDLNIVYNPNVNAEGMVHEIYLNKYLENEEKEIMVGKTLYGVHKDDYSFKYNIDKNLKYHGSRGQQRIGSFIFKMAQLKILNQINTENLILLIDDIMSELDDLHRSNIAKFLLDLNIQILLTGADIKEFPVNLIENGKEIILRV